MKPAPDAGGPLARTLPGRFYHDPAIWQLEQARLFGRLWVLVGRADQFHAVGHYRTVRVGDESVLVVRGGTAWCTPSSTSAGIAARSCARPCAPEGAIQCRYHAWTYELDGRLMGRAQRAWSDQHRDRDAYGLMPVALGRWEG